MEQSAEDGFESAQFLVQWAATQLNELKALIEKFCHTQPYTMCEELDRKVRQCELKVKFHPIPPNIRGKTSGIIKDLRDALDQATNAACHRVSGKPKRCCHFAFAVSPQDFDVAVTKNQCKDIPSELHSILKGYEPYPTGGNWSGGDNLLRKLGYISGPNKHRFTLSPAIFPDSLEIRATDIRGGDISFGSAYNPVARKGEVVIMKFDPASRGCVDIGFSMYLAFSDKHLEGTSLIAYLSYCTKKVGKIVQDLCVKSASIKGV